MQLLPPRNLQIIPVRFGVLNISWIPQTRNKELITHYEYGETKFVPFLYSLSFIDGYYAEMFQGSLCEVYNRIGRSLVSSYFRIRVITSFDL